MKKFTAILILVARLKGARFVNAAEPPQRMLLDNALVKNWTGGDTIRLMNILIVCSKKKMNLKILSGNILRKNTT